MKVLLRHMDRFDVGEQKETVELAAIPRRGDEIHWVNRIVKVVLEPKWFPLNDPDNPHGHVACLYVESG